MEKGIDHEMETGIIQVFILKILHDTKCLIPWDLWYYMQDV